jgi:hypothetical protein
MGGLERAAHFYFILMFSKGYKFSIRNFISFTVIYSKSATDVPHCCRYGTDILCAAAKKWLIPAPSCLKKVSIKRPAPVTAFNVAEMLNSGVVS